MGKEDIKLFLKKKKQTISPCRWYDYLHRLFQGIEKSL